MKQKHRKTVVVDKQIQHGLARRLITYWGMTWLLVFSLPIVARMFTEQLPADQLARQIMTDFWFPIVISVLILPIVIWDCLRFSNRIAGPVYRIRKTIEGLLAGKKIPPIELRNGDFCGSLADEVNKMIDRKPTDSSSSEQDEKNEKYEPVA